MRSVSESASLRTRLASSVLPFLRKAYRSSARLCDRQVPASAPAWLVFGFLGLTLVGGSIAGGHAQRAFGEVTMASGLGISELKVDGARFTSDVEIALAIDHATRGQFFSQSSNARAALEGLPWVEQATVRRLWPAGLDIEIDEHEPFAVWQMNGRRMAIDAEGRTIGPWRWDQNVLPLLVGAGAERVGLDMVDTIADYPQLSERVVAFVRVGDRRWDLRLDNQVTLRLPQDNWRAALDRVTEPSVFTELMARDVLAIDLRLPDRMVVQVSQESADERAKTVEGIEKAIHKASRERQI